MIKKILSIIISLTLILSVSTLSASATTIAHSGQDRRNEEIVQIWNQLRQEGKMYCVDGEIAIYPNSLETNPRYSDFMDTIEFTNETIRQGIAYICDEEQVLVATYPEIALQARLEYISRQMDALEHIERHGPEYSNRTANAENLNLIGLCEDNYDFIVTYYDGCMVIQMANPTTYSAWAATVTCWVTRVREDGPWDYKARDGYEGKTFNVVYNGKSDTVSAEFVGNFNYGYTGSFLFGIDSLIAGSVAIAGSIEKDQHDWPAIKEGYKAKTGENVI